MTDDTAPPARRNMERDGARSATSRRTSPAQRQIDTRALEVESENRAMITAHLDECRDRYIEQRESARASRAEQLAQMSAVQNSVEAMRSERERSSTEIYWTVLKAAGAIVFALVGGMGSMAWLILSHPHP